MTLYTMIHNSTLPNHVAIIMDGNRRWANKNKLPLLMGHRRAAYDVIEPLVDRAIELGISYMTLWAFSTENWRRSKDEVEGLLKLFRETLSENIEQLHKKGVKLRTIGDIEKFPEDIYLKLKEGVEKTAKNNKITVVLALNYGGRNEIVRAIKKIFKDSHSERPKEAEESSRKGLVSEGGRSLHYGRDDKLDNVTIQKVSSYLDTYGMPDPELIIRTGGEQRLSGFLLWQSEYSEFYFTDVLFPDFSPKEFDKAIDEYKRRKRRFGK